MPKKHETRAKELSDIRTFICIEVPTSIKERIGELQDKLRNSQAPVSWTRPSNIHLTLKFLGGVPASRIERVGNALSRAAKGIGPIEVTIGGTGCFPSPRGARVLWVGMETLTEGLRQLYSNIEDELAREGFPREKRKFSPHLTIGRVRVPGKGTVVAGELIEDGFQSESFTATQVILMRSDLKPTGSIYTPQVVVELK